jgi:tRNA-dihydrouridine synthase B
MKETNNLRADKMKIGNIELANNVFLAPMAGVTDMTYRAICKELGCGLTYTEMVSAKGMYYKSENTKELLATTPHEKPVAMQIFGSDSHIMSQIAMEVQNAGADIIDINMGCPTPKIVKNGDGSALMKNPQWIAEIVQRVSAAVTVPVTVKIRIGWDQESINGVEVAQIAEQSGAKAIAVHGRTREQFYSGKADWSMIRKIKEAVNIPVIGNGDVTSPQKAKQLLEETGCDGVMIGRGAEGNPWIFPRTVEYLRSGILLPEPTYKEIITLAVAHLKRTVAEKGEFIGVKEMRKHLAWYLKGMPGSNVVKTEIFKRNSVAEVEEILWDYLNSL